MHRSHRLLAIRHPLEEVTWGVLIESDENPAIASCVDGVIGEGRENVSSTLLAGEEGG